MQTIIEFFNNFWHLSTMIGIYVLIGLIFVGIVHLYVSEAWIQKHLGNNTKYGALKGALYGIPLPLCSCGVIPLATALRKKGASKKSVTSFFITTPMTGIDSIIATYGVFGLPMAILRVVSSFISGVVAGILVKETSSTNEEDEKACCTSCCSSEPNTTDISKFQEAKNYALNTVFLDIVKPLFLGLVLATVFMMLIPKESVEFLNENILLSYLLVYIISLPLYVCSVSAIPLALSMLAVGVSPGVAFIFLAAAPATNIITIGIVKKVLGNDVLFIYISSIIITTLSFALMIDFAFPQEWFHINTQIIFEDEHSLINNIFGAVFIFMMLFYMIKSNTKI